jgi:DNA-binding Lrp family transcriptional regulator
MDATDKRILDIIQTGFPLAPRPYEAIGREVGLTEAETLARVRALRGKGIIRRIGANFQSARIGFKSTLCAASVPAEKLDAFVQVVNAHPGVTHNYLRDHPINVWFTMIGESTGAIREALAAITAATGVSILNLPADRLFKIRVDFSMSEDGETRPQTREG